MTNQKINRLKILLKYYNNHFNLPLILIQIYFFSSNSASIVPSSSSCGPAPALGSAPVAPAAPCAAC